MRPFRLILAAALFLAIPAAHADTFYIYTGNPFITDFFPTPTFIQGYFTVASPSELDGDLFTPESFSFSAGPLTLDSNTPGLTSSFRVSTDSSGDISTWWITLSIGGGSSDIYTIFDRCCLYDMDQAFYGSIHFGDNWSDAGTWAVSTTTTPEPASIILLTTSLLIAAMPLRRRSH